jgi:hypothetical protein
MERNVERRCHFARLVEGWHPHHVHGRAGHVHGLVHVLLHQEVTWGRRLRWHCRFNSVFDVILTVVILTVTF